MVNFCMVSTWNIIRNPVYVDSCDTKESIKNVASEGKWNSGRMFRCTAKSGQWRNRMRFFHVPSKAGFLIVSLLTCAVDPPSIPSVHPHGFSSSSSGVSTVGRASGHVPSLFGSRRKSLLPLGQKSSDATQAPKMKATRIDPANFMTEGSQGRTELRTDRGWVLLCKQHLQLKYFFVKFTAHDNVIIK